MRQRLQTRKQELEELLNDQMERFDEEEEKVLGLTEEKKKLLKDIQDLVDRYGSSKDYESTDSQRHKSSNCIHTSNYQ